MTAIHLRSLLFAAVTAFALGCATGADPMPPRADPHPVPEEVKKHPGFKAHKPHRPERPAARESSAPSCSRTCPEGQHCALVHGLETCVDD